MRALISYEKPSCQNEGFGAVARGFGVRPPAYWTDIEAARLRTRTHDYSEGGRSLNHPLITTTSHVWRREWISDVAVVIGMAVFGRLVGASIGPRYLTDVIG